MIVDLIGIPWALGGRSAAGADCVGIALLAQSEIGRSVPDVPTPVDTEHPRDVAGWEQLDVVADLEPGDVIVATNQIGRFHTIIVAEGGHALTTNAAAGSFLVRLGAILRMPTIKSAWRVAR